MKPLSIIHVKVEKPNLMKLMSNQTLIKNPRIVRVFEIFLILAVTSRLSFEIQPPISLALTLACEYIHTLSLLLVSPPFVFIVGNAIVITLFINSPSYHAERPKSPSRGQRKKEIAGEETIMGAIFPASPPEYDQAVARVYRRSKSERREEAESAAGLRRAKSNMEIRRRGKGYYPEDHMSNEEFRQTIEDFIAKQQKFLRQEEDLISFVEE